MPQGNIRKLVAALAQPIAYQLPIGDVLLPLNPAIGQTCQLTFSGRIHCIHCQRAIKKSYNQGYCFPCARRLAACDICIVRPEKCHYAAGTCREPEWAQDHCMTPHVVYLANTSGLKVGITRRSQIPTRWIDQGAVSALPLIEVENRHHAGLVEVLIAASVQDKTNWRKMLKGQPPKIDLVAHKQTLLAQHASDIHNICADRWHRLEENTVTTLHYPIETFPDKVTALNLDKTAEITGTLLGIKGQYLIFDTGVINMRKYAGYEIAFEY